MTTLILKYMYMKYNYMFFELSILFDSGKSFNDNRSPHERPILQYTEIRATAGKGWGYVRICDCRSGSTFRSFRHGNTGTQEIVTRFDLEREVAPLRTDLAVLKWMAGVGLGIGLTILFKLFH